MLSFFQYFWYGRADKNAPSSCGTYCGSPTSLLHSPPAPTRSRPTSSSPSSPSYLFFSRDLDETFAVLHKGLHYNGTLSTGYNTVKQALDDEALVLPYGNFCIDRIMKRQVGWQLPFQQSEDRIEIAVKMRKRHDCSKPQQHTPFLADSTQLVDHSCDLQQNQ